VDQISDAMNSLAEGGRVSTEATQQLERAVDDLNRVAAQMRDFITGEVSDLGRPMPAVHPQGRDGVAPRWSLSHPARNGPAGGLVRDLASNRTQTATR